MGYDVTFHGITKDIEGKTVLALLNGTLDVDTVISELPNMCDDLPEVVKQWLEYWIADYKEGNKYIASLTSYRLCMLSGYRRKCWYVRGMQGVSFWSETYPELNELINPVTEWIGGPLAGRGDPSSGKIIENYTGSGVIEDVLALKKWWDSTDLGDLVDEEGRWAFESAIKYCIDNNLSFIEVSDVYSPMAGASINVKASVQAMHLQEES